MMKQVAVLHDELKQALQKVREERAFKPSEWIQKKTEMFNEYMRKCGLKACVVSISGGVDSAVTFALAVRAMQQPNSPIKKVYGIAQPIKSTEKIWKRALELEQVYATSNNSSSSDENSVHIVTVDQSEIHTLIQERTEQALGIKSGDFSSGQLKSYMRTPVGFFTAQLLSQSGYPCIVLGTGNYDEDGYLYYFCKAGDGVADVQLIADLHKSEVFLVGKELNVPSSILEAPPSADLWAGQTDENELGFPYDFVELLTEVMTKSEEEQTRFKQSFKDPEALKQFEELSSEAKLIHKRNNHKAKYPLNLNIIHPEGDNYTL
ncbi:hypothetical protein C9374_011598 [Naegleria lovaniensis]|uniref:NAD/GMP synthase domain-containing protein n=1 Tax=Naegleria lovaniensis TaxID=51637 RepID=A0AA88GFH9_NAELO|nr:uncharacterized protein C9374_011598 [Naegleria lovaniensis]KAG2373933.1 hypothetical protein C9374_011598 [Naegleria lovaniensis]